MLIYYHQHTLSIRSQHPVVPPHPNRLTATTLSRTQIYFPRCDVNRYKDLYQHKTKQDAAMKQIRRQSALALAATALSEEAASQGKQGLGTVATTRPSPRASATPSADTTAAVATSAIATSPDPLAIEGFVNIRVKPPLHTRGIRRMTLPADVTITICGPSFTESQRALLHALESFFSLLDSGFITASVVLPMYTPVAREVTVRSSRDEFVAKHGLVSQPTSSPSSTTIPTTTTTTAIPTNY